MKLHYRAKLSARLILPSTPPRKQPVLLSIFSPIQQFNLYSVKATSNILKIKQFPNPRTRKSSEATPSIYRGNEKHSEVLTSWPRPREIPYQAKVANLVNLIGYVQEPVKFEVSSDGKHFAGIVISRGEGGEKNSALIPVVFEGDLAHVVACHVKENDRVFVSGQFRVDPMRLLLSQNHLGSFHILAENLSFVEELKINFFEKGQDFLSCTDSEEPGSVLDRKDGEKDKFKHKNGKGKTVKRARKKKNGDSQFDLWRDLVKNPMQWWDYRDHKSNGLVKDKFPDFKQKASGKGLWLSSAPEWVLPGLEKLELDVKVMGERPEEMGRPSKLDTSWKNLVENPDKWWDNRKNKQNPNGPDFKHKETGEALWLRSSPYLREGRSAILSRKDALTPYTV